MANWKFRDEELKRILLRNNDPDNEEKSVVNTVTELIPHLNKSGYYDRLNPATLAKLKRAKTFHTFNQALDMLYDYADDNKIWLGFMPGD